MHVVEPKVFIIAETVMTPDSDAMLAAIGAPGWFANNLQPGNRTAGELLVEVAGRLCYKSFEVGLNPNVTKVREGNREYIGNILKQKHGSVLEHASTSVAFIGVSRIFTHELVRHRAGAAYSQESMRFVRLDNIPMYIPDLTEEVGEWSQYMIKANTPDSFTGEPVTEDSQDAWVDHILSNFKDAMREVTELAESHISKFGEMLNTPGLPFHIKKVITSALRRFAPGGHSTNIIATMNHRAWRHVIENRTAVGAEEEIRKVFLNVARKFQVQYPNFYQDMTIMTDGSVKFEHSKI